MKTLELCRIGKIFRGKAYSAHLLYSQCLSRMTLSLSLTHSLTLSKHNMSAMVSAVKMVKL